MIFEITKEERKKHQEDLIAFCKDENNYCLMYNYMLTIKEIRDSE